MRTRFLTVCLLSLAPLPAAAEIFKCTGADGHITYSNVQTKGCTRLNLEPISTVPAVKVPPKPSPAGFPRVEENTQKARDSDRRKILEQEQEAEQKALDDAKKKLAEAEVARPEERVVGGAINQAKVQERTQPLRDEIQLRERNLEAIRKELQNQR